MRIRKTISFEEDVYNELETRRLNKPLSTYINEFFRKKFKLIENETKVKGGKGK